MKNKINILYCSFFLFFFIFSNVSAQNGLNNTVIENYIATIPELRELERASQIAKPESNEEADQTPPKKNTELSRTPVSDSLEYLQTQPFYEDFVHIINKYNFPNPKDWASTGDMIMMSYSAYHLKNPPNGNAPSIEALIKDLNDQKIKIEKNPYISMQQKQTLLNKLKNSIAMLNDPNYIENNNISVISPYIERLNSLFKEPQ